MEYYKDMKAYWIKGCYKLYIRRSDNTTMWLYVGHGYPITGKRSVYLVKAILKFLADGKQFISLKYVY